MSLSSMNVLAASWSVSFIVQILCLQHCSAIEGPRLTENPFHFLFSYRAGVGPPNAILYGEVPFSAVR